MYLKHVPIITLFQKPHLEEDWEALGREGRDRV